MGKRIYLDNAASTPVDSRVKKAMEPYFSEIFGNPGSIHSFGQEAQIGVDRARKQIADFLGCSSREIIFTGSATEANNLAVKGIAGAAAASRGKDFIQHIITSAFEHESILDPCRQLEKSGLAEITYLPVSRDGFVSPEDVKKSLKENTVLVSVMYANNEIGTIQPIAEIAKIIRDFRNQKLSGFARSREAREILNSKFEINSKSGAVLPLLHTDAVQAVQFLDCGVDNLGVDFLSLSGQKIYGPKGVGALFVRSGVKIEPLVSGGMQESGRRGGTENVPGIVGLGAAVELAAEGQKDGTSAKIETLRNKLIEGILKSAKSAALNGSFKNRLPNNANILFKNAAAEMMIIALDSEGIAVSAGSACSAKALKPSHVLRAIGLSEKDASSSLRFTLSKLTTEEEIDTALEKLIKLT
ncbi:cysteine desulfurase [Candidatus Wolfebacteria bacterium]|nr:cysteine desulfurase [Candidatus Wolfebacteria bacterium]